MSSSEAALLIFNPSQSDSADSSTCENYEATKSPEQEWFWHLYTSRTSITVLHTYNTYNTYNMGVLRDDIW